MMLGTSPAHEALIHRPVSSSRGVPGGAKHGSVFTAVGAHGRPVRVTRDAYAIFSTRVQRAVLVTVRDWQRCQHGHPALILWGEAHVQTQER